MAHWRPLLIREARAPMPAGIISPFPKICRDGAARRECGWYDVVRPGAGSPAVLRTAVQRASGAVQIREGNKVLFLRHGRALEGRVFAIHQGAYSVEASGNRAFYLDWWEVLLVVDYDSTYAGWLADPLGADASAPNNAR